MKVFIVSGGGEYTRMFVERGWEVVYSVKDADLVQFTGGADVTPELYGEKNTHSYSVIGRDLSDIAVFRETLALGKPMAGICRGGQFLNVMSGGKMIQHVEGHAVREKHVAYDTLEHKQAMVTSTHHQMMLPDPLLDHTLLLYAKIVGEDDTEAVFYPHTKALCFQPHPEFPGAEECRDLYFGYIDEFLC